MSLAELDDRTPAEKAYFESGGEKTEGLSTADAGAALAPAEPQKPSADTDPAKPSPDGAVKPGADPAKAADPAAKPADPADDEEAEEIDHGGKKRRMVNYGALAKERAQRKELEKLLATERESRGKDNEARARVDERLKLITEAMQPQPGDAAAAAVDPAVEDPEPDPEQDIFGWAKWSQRERARLEGKITEAKQHAEKVEGTQRSTAEQSRVVSDYVADARRFAATEPNFAGAYQYMLNSRGQQLKLQGYEDKDIPGIIAREEGDLVKRAQSRKESPAKLIFDMAKSFGFQPKAPQAAAPAPAAAAQPAAAAPAPAAAAPAAAAPSVTDEIDRILAGQGAAKSLSTAGGSSPSPLSLETLAGLSDRDFASVYAKHGKEIEALLGRKVA